MTEITRRTTLRSMALLGAGSAVAVVPGEALGDTGAAHEPSPRIEAKPRTTEPWTEAELRDRNRVLAVGFTEAEADCWLLVARAAGSFLDLEKLHPSDVPEAAEAFHIIQGKLMQRPAYRKYRQLAVGDPGTR